MGWIESSPYCFAASEAARYVAQQYVKTLVGTFPDHKFVKYSAQGDDFDSLPETGSEKFATLSSVLSRITFILLSLHHRNN